MNEIATAIGVRSSSTLNWFISRGAFGVLPKCQGQRQPRKTYKDDERTGQLFGQRKQDWERRLKGVQAGWSPDEEQRRQKGVMPLGEVPSQNEKSGLMFHLNQPIRKMADDGQQRRGCD